MLLALYRNDVTVKSRFLPQLHDFFIDIPSFSASLTQAEHSVVYNSLCSVWSLLGICQIAPSTPDCCISIPRCKPWRELDFGFPPQCQLLMSEVVGLWRMSGA